MVDRHRYWAIRRKTDGRLRPVTRYPSSNTRVEFEDYGEPRLYLTRAAALTSLDWWLGGIAKMSVEWESTNEYGEGYYVSGLPEMGNGLGRNKQPRNPADYEIVEVSLLIWEPPDPPT